jgi:hypothetical protein
MSSLQKDNCIPSQKMEKNVKTVQGLVSNIVGHIDQMVKDIGTDQSVVLHLTKNVIALNIARIQFKAHTLNYSLVLSIRISVLVDKKLKLMYHESVGNSK